MALFLRALCIPLLVATASAAAESEAQAKSVTLEDARGVVLSTLGVPATAATPASRNPGFLVTSELRRQVEFHIREARHSIRDLRSPVLQSRDLVSVLNEAGTHLTATTGIAFQLDTVGTPYRVAQRIEEHLLRIGQEAISNAVRHGRASTIRVIIEYGPSLLTLKVIDDGVGFDLAAKSRANDGHWGLTSMHERAEQVGASVQLETAPGRGTRITVSVAARPITTAA